MKKILILTYYGTMNHEKGIEIYNMIREEFQKKFPELEITQCFNSKRIIKKLKEIHKIELETLEEKLELFKNDKNLKEEIEIFIQPIYLTEGTQYEEIVETGKKYRSYFSTLKIGSPLFTDFNSFEGFQRVLEKKYRDKEIGYIFVGHGSKGAGKHLYGALGYFFQLHHPNYFTVTIEEGVPLEYLEKTLLKNYEKILLVPMLLVPGYHFKKDIQENFVNFLQKKSIPVEFIENSLGEDKDIIELFIENVKKEMP